MQRRYSLTIVFCTIVLSMCNALITQSIAEQPEQEWNTVEVPVYVLIDAEGRAELVTALWGPAQGTPEEILSTVQPASIPIFTSIGKSELIRGVVCFSVMASDGDVFTVEFPQSVEMTPGEKPHLRVSTKDHQLTNMNTNTEPGPFMALVSTTHSVSVSSLNGATKHRPQQAEPISQLSWNDNLQSIAAKSSRVPAWIEFDELYNATMIYCLQYSGLPRDPELTSVPILTTIPGKPLHLGVQQINDPGDPIITNVLQSSAVPLIDSIRHSDESGYYLVHGGLLRSLELLEAQHRVGAPDRTPVPNSHRAVIVRQSSAANPGAQNNAAATRGNILFQFPNFTGNPPGVFTANEMRSAMLTASSDFFSCISNGGVVKVDIVFSDLGGPTPTMSTNTRFVAAPYGLILDNLELWAGVNNELAEEIIYADFPQGSLPVKFDANTTTQVTQVAFPRVLLQTFGNGVDGTEDATLTINTNNNIKWDLNPKDGLGASQLDFIGVFTHELMHVLGFSSILPTATTHPMPSTTLPTILDCFRFESQSIGQDADSFELMTLPRRIERGVQSVTVTLKDQSQGLYDMSTGKLLNNNPPGDTFQANHWKFSVDRANLIGIMDPGITVGEIYNPKLSDYRALDIAGWNLNADNCANAVQAVMIQNDEPLNGANDVELDPILRWSTNGSEDSTSIVIWDFQGNEVFQQTGIMTQLIQVPSGVLDFEMTYEWAAFTVNGDAVGQSEYWSFTTESEIIIPPDCPADLNSDGSVDTADVGGLLIVFGNTGTPGTVFGDINGDGIVDTADLGLLIAGFGPCPG